MRQVYGMNDNKTLIILKKFTGGIRAVEQNLFEVESGFGIFVDVETTGLNFETDKIINLAYVLFEYNKKNGEIIKVIEKLSELEDPQIPLSPFIKKLTGFKDEDLKGKKISWDKVEEDFLKANLIISHNAAFDRKFIDKKALVSQNKVWACSMDQVDWKGKGHGSRALEYLAKDHGFFFEGHQALIDVEVGVYLMSLIDPVTGETYFQELLKNARTRYKYICVEDCGNNNTLLKQRGYRWDNLNKVLKIKTLKNTTEEEDFLYQNQNLFPSFKTVDIRLEDNFKEYL